MNWDAISFDWNQVRAFLATAEEGSFSGAARALGLTQPTLGRQVAGLEQKLGIALFERIGRSLSLTPSGRELLEHVRVMAEAASRVSLVASGQAQDVSGRVMITASDVLSAYHLPPILKELRAVAPALEIEVVAANDIRDLQRREADIAIRHVRPEQPELFARLVREETANLYASGAYLDTRGRPKDLGGLSAHDFIGFGDVDRMIAYLEPLGIHLSHDNFRANCALGLVSWALARQGLGIAAMSDLVAAQCPEMERVLPTMEPITFPVWLTTHRELHTSRRIRLVFDVLADGLARGTGVETVLA
ncbi:MAG: LysR family transcriptional regulator [Alphaproteobacteria bacterium]|nr:LysR family transcriptional regulator [Alphaproteobacteria bacterium]NNF24395.1 LysR family transcriptional regulator [Paracoccaceae bacterium]